MVEPRLVLSDADHVIFPARVTAQRDGRRLDVTNAYHFGFRGGRPVEGRLFPLTSTPSKPSSAGHDTA